MTTICILLVGCFSKDMAYWNSRKWSVIATAPAARPSVVKDVIKIDPGEVTVNTG